jgi:uncharacterized integral membrane protein
LYALTPTVATPTTAPTATKLITVVVTTPFPPSSLLSTLLSALTLEVLETFPAAGVLLLTCGTTALVSGVEEATAPVTPTVVVLEAAGTFLAAALVLVLALLLLLVLVLVLVLAFTFAFEFWEFEFELELELLLATFGLVATLLVFDDELLLELLELDGAF